jgi:hypothetical protein
VTVSNIFRTLQTSIANPCAIAGVCPFNDEHLRQMLIVAIH